MVTRKMAWSLVLVAAFFSLLAFIAQARGQEPPDEAKPDEARTGMCSLASLKGIYSGVLQGTMVAQPPTFPPAPWPFPFPMSESTMHIYDGAGHFSGKAKPNYDGFALPWTPFTGTYTVDSDCNYSAELTTSSGTIVQDVGTITGAGMFREIREIWSIPGAVVTGTLKKAPPWGCSLASLNGTYGFLEQGTITAQLDGFPPPPIPDAVVGTITYDGNGNASLSMTVNIDGMTFPLTYSGTYTVNSDCTYTDQLTSSNGPVTTDAGAITGVGIFQEVHYINTSHGFVAAGVAKKQLTVRK
jgi:hypothetical protein